jgi:hypothetical protein
MSRRSWRCRSLTGSPPTCGPLGAHRAGGLGADRGGAIQPCCAAGWAGDGAAADPAGQGARRAGDPAPTAIYGLVAVSAATMRRRWPAAGLAIRWGGCCLPLDCGSSMSMRAGCCWPGRGRRPPDGSIVLTPSRGNPGLDRLCLADHDWAAAFTGLALVGQGRGGSAVGGVS